MLNKRVVHPNMVDTNVTILSLSEAVKRWTETGTFYVNERPNDDAYESKDVNIPFSEAQQQTVDKIDAVLAGIDFVKEQQAVESAPAESAPAESAPAESAPAE